MSEQPKFDTPEEAYSYAYYNKCLLNLENEQLVGTSTYYSYCYACILLKSRFKLGEKAIVLESCYSAPYIKTIFNKIVPLDFLELCSVKTLEDLIEIHKDDIINKKDLIKVLFKKKLLS